MKTSTLKWVISCALTAHLGMYSVAEAQQTILDPITVIGTPIGGGIGSGGGGGGEWGGGASTTQEDNNNPTQEPWQCYEARAAGLPPDCDRNLAFGGTQTPQFSNPWKLDELLAAYRPHSFATNSIEANARYMLAECYGDESIAPGECEAQYLSALSTIGQYFPDPRDQLIYLGAMSEMQNRMSTAAFNRDTTNFFTTFVPSYSYKGFRLNTSWLANFFMYDQYNQALIHAKKQKICEAWMSAWEQYGCA